MYINLISTSRHYVTSYLMTDHHQEFASILDAKLCATQYQPPQYGGYFFHEGHLQSDDCP